MVNKHLQTLLDGLFPAYCALCRLPSGTSLPLCEACFLDLPANRNSCSRCAVPLPPRPKNGQPLCANCLQRPPPFARVIAPWIYEERLAHLVQRWKFDHHWHLTRLLAWLWLQQAPPTAVDVIVPVPLHWTRLLQRGCNQSELLLRELRKLWPEPAPGQIDPRLVQRSRPHRVPDGHACTPAGAQPARRLYSTTAL